MISVHRASARFRTDQPGITTYHSFSSGAHYDASNLSFGPVVACDEHLLDPGAGFAPHRHARVELVSWVVDGVLRHRGPATGERDVRPGQAQYQLTGDGIEHEELNASESEPLHFVQLWLATGEELTDYDVAAPPVRTTTGVVDVLTSALDVRLAASLLFVFVVTGEWTVGEEALRAGDSLRASGSSLTLDGAGQLLVVSVPG